MHDDPYPTSDVNWGEQVQETTLEENSEHTIRWRWTADGKYTTNTTSNLKDLSAS